MSKPIFWKKIYILLKKIRILSAENFTQLSVLNVFRLTDMNILSLQIMEMGMMMLTQKQRKKNYDTQFNLASLYHVFLHI